MVPKAPLRAGLWTAWLLILVPASMAQDAAKAAKPPEDPNPLKELTVSPADVPTPALKYRLLPRPSDLNPGNAAPLYLRIRHEMTDPEPLKKIDKLSETLDQPMSEFPKEEVRGLVDSFSSRLKQLDFGARRQTCDWAFSLPEQRQESINILLPDTQEMRRWARLLALKIRVEVAEGKTDEALRTIQTELAFGRHVSENPFLIGSLVGIAIEFVTLNRMEELITQPGSPNLYWALTDLPRPLVDMRGPLSEEERFGENMIPELNGIDGQHTPAEWAAILSKIYAGMVNLARTMGGNEIPASVKALSTQDVNAFRKSALADAKAYLRSSKGLTDDQIRVMSDDQVVATYIAGRYREVRDDIFKLSNLPFPEALESYKGMEDRIKALKKGPLAVFVELFPSLLSARLSGARLDRTVSAYRVLEALRIYAARHDGALPKALADVKEVTIPIDPITGKAFDYKLQGKSAVLFAPLTDNRPKTGIHWRITIR
ncbi:MAG: hypothetical protein U0800_12115 [Isosphaeraceae bacterium]